MQPADWEFNWFELCIKGLNFGIFKRIVNINLKTNRPQFYLWTIHTQIKVCGDRKV